MKLNVRYLTVLFAFSGVCSGLCATLNFHVQNEEDPYFTATPGSLYQDLFVYSYDVVTGTPIAAGEYALIFPDGSESFRFNVGNGTNGVPADTIVTNFNNGTGERASRFGKPGIVTNYEGGYLLQGGVGFVGYVQGGWSISLGKVVKGEPVTVVSNGTYTISAEALEPPLGDDEDWLPPSCGAAGMARWTADELHAALNIVDTPISYEPGFGPAMDFTVTYQQNDLLAARSSSSSSLGFTHLGVNWSFNWLSYITDTPGSDNPVSMIWNGSKRTFADFNATTQTYGPHRDSRNQLKRLDANRYELTLPDGSRRLYEHPGGTSGTQRRIFLTQVVDAQGNAAVLTYDASHRITRITDATGGRWFDLAYESEASDFYRLTKVTERLGRSAAFLFDSNARLQSVTDTIMLASSFTYDAANFVTTLTTPYGATNFVRGSVGPDRWLEVTDTMGGRERFEYRDRCILIPDSDPSAPTGVANSGLQKRNSFHWTKKALMGTLPNGEHDYAKASISRWLVSADGTKTVGVLHSRKEPLETRVWLGYAGQPDANKVGNVGLPIRIARRLDDGTTQAEQMTYDAASGNVTQRIDPKGRITNFSYTNGIDLYEVRQQVGAGTELLQKCQNYTLHRPQTITDAAGKVTSLTYNARGQVETVTNALNEVTKWTYVPSGSNGFGKVQTSTSAFGSALAATSTYTYDAQHRVIANTSPDGYALSFLYDAIGANPLKTLDRLTEVLYPDSTSEEVIWTNLDAEYAIDRAGRQTRYVRDNLRRVTQVIDPLNRTTNYDWCECGALDSLTDANNHLTSWDRDVQGRITAKKIDGQTVATHVYETATSRLKSTTDALGQTTTYTYGLDDQPAGIAYTGAAVTTPNVTFAYETNYPRLSSMTMAGVGTISQAFVPIDPANSVYGDGQLATVTGLWGDVTTYTYDQLGRVTGRQINGANNPATAAYDALGRVTGWSNSLGSFSPSYLVAGNGALTGRADFVTLPNGGKTDLGWAAALGDYRLQQIKNVGAGAATLSQFDTVQNPVGQITQWKQWHSGLGAGVAARRHEIGYDAADQIIGDEVRDDVSNALVKAFSYRFDPAGNRTGEQVDASVTTGAFNAKNQLTNLNAGGTATVIGNVSEAATVKVNGDVVALDAQRVWRKELTVAPGLNSFPVEATETSFTPGTVAQKTTKTLTLNVPVNPARTFAYNLNGSMTSDGGTRSFEWDGANRLTKILYTGTNLTTELSYDGQSRCIKLVEKNGVAVTSEKRFVWTGLTMAEERNASNVVQKQFHDGGVRLGATSYYYTRDHLGSIREVTDSTGTVRTRYEYDPWGRRTKLFGGASDPEADFGFTGHYYHAASGLHLAPFRQYDAGLGRWLSRDPIEERGGLNLYQYTFNNPVNWTDPTGLDVWIEAASHNEPKGHISINVGNPNARYYSQSFGVIDPMTRGLWGGVYEDIDTGGRILNYFKTTAEQDAVIEAVLRKKEGNEARYGPVTCRSYTKDQFRKIRDAVNLPESQPPPRKPVPATGIRQYLNPVTPATSSSSFDASSGSTQGTGKP